MAKVKLITDSIPTLTRTELKYVKRDLRTLGDAIGLVDSKVKTERDRDILFQKRVDERLGVLSDSLETKDFDAVVNENRRLNKDMVSLNKKIDSLTRKYDQLFNIDNKQDLSLEVRVNKLDKEVDKSWSISFVNWLKGLWK